MSKGVYIVIKKCSDPSMWYAHNVGKLAFAFKKDDEYYYVKEFGTDYTNIVLLEDADEVQTRKEQ